VTAFDGYYVIDGEDRIVRVWGGLQQTLGRYCSHSLWECTPHAEPLFGPHFDEARKTGCEVEFTAFYAGRLARRRVVPAGQTLTVHVAPLEELDVRTLGTLAESLRRIEAELAAREPAPLDLRAHGSPQALP